MKKTYTLTEALNTKRGRELISSIEEAENELRDRAVDFNDEDEFWALARQQDIRALREEFGLSWE